MNCNNFANVMTKTSIQRRLFTVSDYYKISDAGILSASDRVELIHGEILKMSPIKSQHAGVVNELSELLILALSGRAIVTVQNPLRLDEYTEPEPDIAVVKYRKDKYRTSHPMPEDVFLVIEVADSSLQYDRQVKVPLYAQAGIPEYWIINIADRQIEIFRQPSESDYEVQRIVEYAETATCSTIELSVPAAALFY